MSRGPIDSHTSYRPTTPRTDIRACRETIDRRRGVGLGPVQAAMEAKQVLDVWERTVRAPAAGLTAIVTAAQSAAIIAVTIRRWRDAGQGVALQEALERDPRWPQVVEHSKQGTNADLAAEYERQGRVLDGDPDATPDQADAFLEGFECESKALEDIPFEPAAAFDSLEGRRDRTWLEDLQEIAGRAETWPRRTPELQEALERSRDPSTRVTFHELPPLNDQDLNLQPRHVAVPALPDHDELDETEVYLGDPDHTPVWPFAIDSDGNPAVFPPGPELEHPPTHPHCPSMVVPPAQVPGCPEGDRCDPTTHPPGTANALQRRAGVVAAPDPEDTPWYTMERIMGGHTERYQRPRHTVRHDSHCVICGNWTGHDANLEHGNPDRLCEPCAAATRRKS